MGWTAPAETRDKLLERPFTLTVDGRSVPGLYWHAESAESRLVLLGHGGTTHKRIEYIVGMAQLLTHRGISCMAIDGPGHGDRTNEPWGRDPDQFARVWHANGGNDAMLADWRAALDFIESEHGQRPTGWWGLSMGTMMGLPVTATDSRIQVALLGLMGTWGPNGDALSELAPQVRCPVRFLVQWDDEVVPRDACLELFGMIGSRKKTLHANPGAHADVPTFEINASADYLDKHLR